MFRENLWRMTSESLRESDKRNLFFLKTVLNQNSSVKAIRDHEILLTTENADSVRRQHDVDICTELNGLERERFLRERARIKQQCNEVEIRQLLAQIQHAHLQKTSNDQRIANQKLREQENQAYREEILRCREEFKKYEEVVKEAELREKSKKSALRQELLEQIKKKEMARRYEIEEVMREREKRLKDIEKFQRDDAEARRQKDQYAKECGQHLKEFLERRALQKIQAKLEDVESNRRYLKLLRDKEEEKQFIRDERKKKLLERSAISERLGQHVYKLEMEKIQRNELLFNLHIEENKIKEDRQLQTAREKEKQQTVALRTEMNRVHLERAEQQEAEKKREQIMALSHLKRFAELEQRDKELRENQERRRREFELDLCNIIKMRREKQAEIAEENKQEYDHLVDMERQRLENIAKERIALLRAEPREILQFIPSGVLYKEERRILNI
uniref:Meiosis-specific nuclear structural protein 1 n=1 Tax=Glossina brevipalpis TaxID=37001 RepID=A0A1A9W4Q4_9MUSC